MDYRKPGKERRDKEWLKNAGIESNPYNIESIPTKKTLLIVCEGENTEPCYFKKFPVPSKVVEVIGGCGSKTALVEHAIKLRTENEDYADREVWCVYDFDIKPDEAATQPQDFNNSIKLSQSLCDESYRTKSLQTQTKHLPFQFSP